MIFITVGMHTQPFDRLLKKVDELLEKGKIKDKIIAQIGHSNYKPKNYEYFNFASEEKMIELMKKAKIVITHAGAGSIITGLKFKKALIVVPRRKEFGEHVDDHQLEMTKVFEKERKILACYDVENLDELIKKTKEFKPTLDDKELKIVKIVEKFLSQIKNF